MQKVLFILVILLNGIMFSGFSQENTVTQQTKPSDGQTIEVYYFHMSRRCPTCLAVESESEAALKKLYPTQMESGTMTFKSLDIEDEMNKPLAEKLGVSGQTLLIVKGDTKIDMTGDGFLYARTDPEKLQEKIKAAIDPLL
jgi:hypothetical protein